MYVHITLNLRRDLVVVEAGHMHALANFSCISEHFTVCCVTLDPVPGRGFGHL